jgi:PAS domain S-box-containing protein
MSKVPQLNLNADTGNNALQDVKNDTRFRKLIENSYEGITLLDKDLNIIYRSHSANRIGGWDTNEVKNTWIELTHPDDKKEQKFLIDDILVNPGKSRTCDFRIKHFEGHYIWLQCTFTNHLNDPEITAIVLNFRDISEEKELQIRQEQIIKELEERNTFIETILQNLPIGIAVNKTDNGKVTVINKRFSETYGWSDDDLSDTARFFKKAYPDETYRNIIMERVMEDIKSGDPARMIWNNITVTTQTGEQRIVNSKNIPLPDQNLMISTVVDVTNESRQATELKRIKTNLEATINGTRDLIWSMDTDLRIISINNACLELMKKRHSRNPSEGDYLFLDWDLDESRKKWKGYYQRALKGESFNVKDQTFDPVKQSPVYIHISFNPMYDADGNIFGIACYAKDITEETNNLHTLNSTKTDLEKIMNSSLDMIFTVSAEGYILKVSAASKAILGYSPEELIGKLQFDFLYPEDREKSQQMADGVLQGNNAINFENRYVRKDGSLANLLWSATWNPKDQLRYGIARDITEKKKNEIALVESEKKYKFLFENNPLPLVIWDFETYRIIDCNKEAEIRYGYTKEEFLKLTTKDLRPPEDVPHFEAVTRTEETYGTIYKGTWRHKKKNGEVIFVNITGLLMNYNGKRVSLTISEDITESRYYRELDILEKNIFEMYSAGNKSLKEVVEIYLLGMEELHPGMLCSLQELRGKRLYNLASPSLPNSFLEIFEGIEIGDNVGSCGTAAFLKQKVIVTDILNDPRWKDYKEIALVNQLKACWSQPVLDGKGNVMATFANYFKEVKEPSKLEENTIQRAVHLLQVILEGYQQKLALQLSNERFEFVTEATSDIIWDWNLETNGVYYSNNMNKLFGHRTGVSYDNLSFYYEHLHPADRDKVVLFPQQVKYGTMINWTQEYRFKKADGRYAFVLDKGLVIRNENGLGVRMVGAMQDVTKQKLEERRLKLLESVVTNTRDSILITEAEPLDFHGPQILYVNEAFTKMTGYTAEEVMGKTPRILQGPKTDKEELKRLKECLQQWQPCEITVINYKKNGDEFWINFSVVPVADDTGWYTHWIAIEKDVTDSKNVELQNALLTEISQVFAKNTGLKESLYKSLEKLVECGNFSLAEFWLIDIYKNKLIPEAQYFKNEKLSSFANQTMKSKGLAKGEGFPGITWETESIQYWNYKANHKNVRRVKETTDAGIKRAYSLPLFHNEEVIGTLVLLMEQDETPDLGLSTVFENFSKKLGAEIKRKQLEEELDQVFRFTPDILCIASTDGHFIKVNPAMSILLEYDEKELLTRPYIEFVHPKDKKYTLTELQDIIDGRDGHSTYYFENRYITKSGKVKWLAWTITKASEKGVLFCSAKDITGKKEVEELLNKATRLARIGAWEADMDKGLVYWSPITREIYETEPGFNPDLDDITNFYKDGTDRETIVKIISNAIKTGTPGDIELQIVTAKGNIKWVRTIIEAEFADGKCSRLFGSFQDIDARKRAEIALEESLIEKKDILESIEDAFFAVDKNCMVTYWNKMAAKLLGKAANQMLNQNLWEVFSHLIESVSYKKFQQAIETNQAVHFEDYYLPSDTWLEISCYPSKNGLSVYFKDITDRKASENNLKELNETLQNHTKELAMSNAELEQFAYVASHDLQEPLRMVTSFLTQLERKYGEVIDDKGKQYIHFAVDGAKRMRQIILDLLEFSRVGRTDDDFVEVDLNKLIVDINTLFKKRIQDEKATIIFNDLPTIQTFKTPIRQVLQNLISNSLKYHKKGEPPVIHISCEETDFLITISIKDNGIGINKDYFDKIFIIFQRLHNKDEYSGTGMGLAITKKIVENLGGTIWLTSEEGQGTTFNFTILKKIKA